MDLLLSLQRWINDEVRAYLIAFGQSGDWTTLASMAMAGIFFGAIHALTPGHSKTILVSYLAGSRHGAFRALSVSSLLAAAHVLIAVIIALFASQLMERSIGQAGRAPDLEFLSRFLLLLIGLWLFVRAVRGHHAASGQAAHATRGGIGVALSAGLIPCPLTLFVMVLAVTRGVPAAGLTFAGSMLIGIALTLGLFALLAVAARHFLVSAMTRYGTGLATVSRLLDGLAGSFIILFAGLDLLKG
jgi:ABC-type nickel/cobalt efflux system permease component RcnA